LYRRPDAALLERWIPADWQKDYVGGPAALMLVDYLHSDAGPYRELLFVPGRFRIHGKAWPMITRIVVSTWESVANGRINWAIPKETAQFQVEQSGNETRWRVEQDDHVLADVTVRAVGPSLPITTSIMPDRWATVAQPRKDEILFTHLKSSGRGRVGRITEADFGGDRFPDLGGERPLLASVVAPFRMHFPEPVVKPL
ncbi:MAG: acetoacetate decarboxylase family protein, partial [Xanthomonadales bacterium]|nr:acetoacetate decarboxylase family protein [Xanthomonadales bacterium]